jgi:hypothetical protein
MAQGFTHRVRIRVVCDSVDLPSAMIGLSQMNLHAPVEIQLGNTVRLRELPQTPAQLEVRRVQNESRKRLR